MAARRVVWTAGLAAVLIAWATNVLPAASPDEVPGTERSAHLTAMKTRTAEPQTMTAMTVSEILALPAFPRRYSRPQLAAMAELEARGVAVIGYVALVDPKLDGDYHVQLTEQAPARCLTRTTPEQIITELTPAFQARRPAYTLARLRALCGTAMQVRVSGWLLYDSPHERSIGRGRGTLWEIHPITKIEVFKDGAWHDLDTLP
jgi:hypothetical protein